MSTDLNYFHLPMFLPAEAIASVLMLSMIGFLQLISMVL